MGTIEPTADESAGMDWWNSIDEAERAYWLAEAGSAVPADAWATYQSRPRYTVTERPVALGGGWTLKLWIGNEEMGGGVFPLVPNPENPDFDAAYQDALDEGEGWIAD